MDAKDNLQHGQARGSSAMLYPGLAIVSAATLLLELVLTRIFDVILQSNLSYLVVSSAIFGFGLGGIILMLWPMAAVATERLAARASLAFAACVLALIPLLTLLPFDLKRLVEEPWGQLPLLLILYAGVLAPFLASGLVISIVLTRYASRVHRLYFWDLTGAGVGCVSIFFLPTLIGAGRTMIVVAALATLSAWLFGGRGFRGRDRVAFAAMVVFLVVAVLAGDVEFQAFALKRGALLGSREHAEWSRWDPVSKIDVIDEGSGFRKRVAYDGGAQSSSFFQFDGDFENARRHYFDIVGQQPRYNSGRYVALAHWLERDRSPRTLVIGSAGGQETLAALTWGSRHVDAVEMVCAVIEAARGPYANFIGRIFDDPRVRTVCEEGRSFLRHTDERYDIIQMHSNHTTASIANGARGVNPVYLQTVEAYEEYFSHLTDDGILQINYFVYPRMLTTAAAAWARLFPGDDFKQHLVITSGYVSMTTFLVKRSPWTAGEIAEIRTFLSPDFAAEPRWNYQLLFAPGQPEERNIPGEFFDVPVPPALEARLPYRIAPPTDNKPFFRDLRQVVQKLVPDEQGYVPEMTAQFLNASLRGWLPLEKAHLYALGGLSLVSSMFFVFVPLVWVRQRGLRQAERLPALLYFSCLGLGFVIVELVLLFKCVLIVGHPIRSMATVLFTLLVAAGAGSRASERLSRSVGRAAILIIPVFAVVAVAFVLGFPYIARAALSLGQVKRILLTGACLVPLGMALGMPFPLGIEALRSRSPDLIPWAWGMNGFMTVVGSLVAIVASMRLGFDATLFLAIGFYLVAFFAYLALTRSRGAQTPPISRREEV
ncbi:MAG: hypothetical protein HY067_16650 [Betaproteobacteria bacterium]|nr:hypothetical protein [Betaproteobacteria bacterium]